MIEFKNCTPHVVKIIGDKSLKIEPCGIVPRVKVEEKLVSDLFGFEINKVEYGEVEDLPEEEEGVYLIVDVLVKLALPERKDLFSPGDPIWDQWGEVLGYRGLYA